jgi:hypothetical protein
MEGIRLKKFNGSQENYHIWRRDFNSTMVLKDLGYITTAKKLPTGKDSTETDKINSDNLKVYSYLSLTLDSQSAAQIELTCPGDGFEALKQISDKYEKKSLLHSTNLRIELADIRLEEGGDM